MSALIDTTEMYLKTIYEMVEDGVAPLRARIVERLEQSGPTVSQTVGRMERDGLVALDANRKILLTRKGQAAAISVIRKHRLAERLLLDVIGLEWDVVHEEACRWEHVMGKQVVDRLVELLEDPQTDPYGNVIPPHKSAWKNVRSLAEVLSEVGRQADKITLVRIGEPVQAAPGCLESFWQAQLLAGTEIQAGRGAKTTTITQVNQGAGTKQGGEVSITIDNDLIEHIFVSTNLKASSS